ncbi:kinase-like domain-containing protein [Chytriomyces cf. hyalinus JEL632]|nr:kinase-like domain-containing protein [Chytriomyces cf. hyalinus JEL632]
MGPAGFLMSPTFSRQYKLGRVLGEGGFGVVMAATRLTDGRQVAIKFINTAEVPCDRWLPDSRSPTGVLVPSEIAILQQLRHPNIIQYIDHMVEENKCFLLITELHGSEWQRSPSSAEPCSSSAPTDDARGGKLAPMDLFACLVQFKAASHTHHLHIECLIDHHLPEPVARTIFSQIVLGVQHLQLNGLVHRDIKDENIVIDSNYSVKIIDFGSAAYIPRNEGEHFAQFLGTALYGSPEIIKGETCGGPEAEIWALGVLLFIMVFGESPFQNEAQIAEGTVRMPKGFHLESDRDYHDGKSILTNPEWCTQLISHYTSGCRNLLRSMLQYTPECRITIDEVSFGFCCLRAWVLKYVLSSRSCSMAG